MAIAFVIIGLIILIIAHECGHFTAAKAFKVKVEEFGIGFPPKIISKRVGETEYSMNLIPLGGFVRIQGEDGEDINREEAEKAKLDVSRSFVNQPIWRRCVIVVSGVVMNVVVGWVLLTAMLMIGSPEHLMVQGVVQGMPGDQFGLESGDIVYGAKWNNVELKDPVKRGEFIEFVKSTKGEEFDLTIERNETIIEKRVKALKDPIPGQGALGVSVVEIGFAQKNFIESISEGARQTGETLILIAKSFGHLLKELFIEREVPDGVTGPIGIVTFAAKAGSLGLSYLLHLLAIISLNLAVLNIIPFPALDGGRLVLLGLEKVKGSPLSRRFQAVVNATGFVVLIIVGVLVAIRDINNL